MAYGQLPNKGRAGIFDLVESTQGTLPASGNFDELAIATCTFQVQEQESVTMEQGRPMATNVRHHSAHITGTINVPLRYGPACTRLLAPAFRDTTFPSQVANTPAAVSFLNSVSHVDGSTGPQLLEVGSTTEWDALEAASSLADCESQLWRVTLAATAGNNSATRGPLLVKAGNPRIISSDQAVDLDDRLHQTADGWGGTFTEDTADALAVNAGAMIGLRVAVPAGNPTYSLIIRIADIATPQYFSLSGVTLGGPTLGTNNRGDAEWQIPFVAATWTDLTVTTPTSGTYTDPTNVYNPIISGGAQMTKLLLASSAAIVALEGDEVSGLTWSAAGPVTVMHDTHGQDTAAGYTLGAFTPAFGFTYHLKQAASPKPVTLQTWANAHTPLLAIVEFTDSDGNILTLKMNQIRPASTIVPDIGGEGPMSGSFSAKCEEDTRTGLPVTYHEHTAD